MVTLVFLRGLCGYVWVNIPGTHFITPEGTISGMNTNSLLICQDPYDVLCFEFYVVSSYPEPLVHPMMMAAVIHFIEIRNLNCVLGITQMVKCSVHRACS